MPQVRVRLWGRVPEQSYFAGARGDVLRNTRLRRPAGRSRIAARCRAFESREWFEDGETSQSFAFLPLRTAQHVRRAGARQSTIRGDSIAGMGTRLSDAARRAGERRDRALPSAVIADRSERCRTDRRVRHGRAECARPNARAAFAHASFDAAAAHARTRTCATSACLPQLAGGLAARGALPRATARRFLATLHARGLSGQSLARMLSAWRAFYRFAIERDRSLKRRSLRRDSRTPKSSRALAVGRSRPTKRCRLVDDRRRRRARGARPRAVRARLFVGPAACPSLPGLERRARRSD